MPSTLALAGVLTLWLLTRAWLQRRRRDRPPRFDDLPAEVAALAVRFETWLRRQGGAGEPALTWQERSARVGGRTKVSSFLRSYDRLRFGRVDPSTLADADERWRRSRKVIRID